MTPSRSARAGSGRRPRGWWWLWRHRDVVAARRREVQARPHGAATGTLSRLLTGDFAPGESTGLAAPAPLRAASRGYWAVARRLLERG